MVFDLGDVANGFLGGLLIGAAAALFLLLNGRIAGISGILGEAFVGARTRFAENLAFLAGLIAVPAVYALVVAPPEIGITTDLNLLLVGGLLVGIGTRLGSGCTSGHGVCGIARLSPRSIVATAVFMGCAVLTVFLARQFGVA